MCILIAHLLFIFAWFHLGQDISRWPCFTVWYIWCWFISWWVIYKKGHLKQNFFKDFTQIFFQFFFFWQGFWHGYNSVVVRIASLIPIYSPVQSNFNEIGYTLKSVILNIFCIPIRHLEYSQGFAAGQWFSLGTPVTSTNKTDCHVITEILWKVVLNTINLTLIHPWVYIGSGYIEVWL